MLSADLSVQNPAPQKILRPLPSQSGSPQNSETHGLYPHRLILLILEDFLKQSHTAFSFVGQFLSLSLTVLRSTYGAACFHTKVLFFLNSLQCRSARTETAILVDILSSAFVFIFWQFGHFELRALHSATLPALFWMKHS
jgi:hypothetical protein